MASEKVVYWLGVAVMMATLVNSTPIARTDWFGALQDRSLQLADEVSWRASNYLAVAQMRIEPSSRCVRTQLLTQRMQTHLARVQSVMAREQAGLARLEAARAKVQARAACIEAATEQEREQVQLSF
jgi:hypothetical protein